jgi:hypothetical protein
MDIYNNSPEGMICEALYIGSFTFTIQGGNAYDCYYRQL